MPKKHQTSYKHYQSTSSAIVLNAEVGHDHDQDIPGAEGPSVIERLARSRASAGPSTSNGRRGGGWIVETSSMPLRAAWPDFDSTTITNISNPPRRAAGPSAPPSWRNAPRARSSISTVDVSQERVITRDDLVEASSLLGENAINPSPVMGVQRLLHHVYRSVIEYLDCPEIYWIDEDGTSETYSQVLRSKVRDYREDFKAGLLANHSSHSNPRLSDRSIQAILHPPNNPNNIADSSSDDDDDDGSASDWDSGPLTERIHHLGITLHPDPCRLLRPVNLLPTVALTSLDLAYSTIPHVEKLVTALPTGMKQLGMVGVRYSNEKDFVRMLDLLGKKLSLLHTLDLSHSKYMSITALAPLLHPPERQLPSLRRLGLRGVNVIGSRPSTELDASEKTKLEGCTNEAVRKQRAMWTAEIMFGRTRYVEVVWE